MCVAKFAWRGNGSLQIMGTTGDKKSSRIVIGQRALSECHRMKNAHRLSHDNNCFGLSHDNNYFRIIL